MPRKYELRQRAARQEETRRRIVEAAMELHGTVGPARSTITAVAEKAGVQRHTVYRHFPTEDDLFVACTTTWDERNPFPDPAPWFAVEDPEERLRRALGDVYAYFAAVEPQLVLFARDADVVPAAREAFAAEAAQRGELRDALSRGWGARGRARRRLLASIGLALEFDVWRTLSRQGLSPVDGAELMTRLARAAAA